MNIGQAEEFGEKPPRIKRGRVDSLTLYEITDYELDVLTNGSPGSVFLNLAIFCLSSALSTLVALLTTSVPSPRTYNTFVVFIAIAFIAGALFFVLWITSYRSINKTVKRIKERVPS